MTETTHQCLWCDRDVRQATNPVSLPDRLYCSFWCATADADIYGRRRSRYHRDAHHHSQKDCT